MIEINPIASDFYGQQAELKAQLRAAEKGWVVSLPTTQARYDLILDDGARLYRSQVKWGARSSNRADGAVIVDLRKGESKGRLYSADEVDVLLVYVQPVDAVCWFDAEHFCGKTAISIRYEAAKNGMKKGCFFAEDFKW